MKRLLTGALGSLCHRLELVERRMEQLSEQGTAQGNSLALLNSQVGQLCRGLSSSYTGMPTKQDPSLSPAYALGELRLLMHWGEDGGWVLVVGNDS